MFSHALTRRGLFARGCETGGRCANELGTRNTIENTKARPCATEHRDFHGFVSAFSASRGFRCEASRSCGTSPRNGRLKPETGHIRELSSRKRGVGDRGRTVLPCPGRKRAGDYRNQKRVVKVIKQFVTKSFSIALLGPPRRQSYVRKTTAFPAFEKSPPRKDRKTERVITRR